MVSEIQLDDAEIEAHLFAGALNLENPTRLTCMQISFFLSIYIYSQTILFSNYNNNIEHINDDTNIGC